MISILAWSIGDCGKRGEKREERQEKREGKERKRNKEKGTEEIGQYFRVLPALPEDPKFFLDTQMEPHNHLQF